MPLFDTVKTAIGGNSISFYEILVSVLDSDVFPQYMDENNKPHSIRSTTMLSEQQVVDVLLLMTDEVYNRRYKPIAGKSRYLTLDNAMAKIETVIGESNFINSWFPIPDEGCIEIEALYNNEHVAIRIYRRFVTDDIV